MLLGDERLTPLIHETWDCLASWINEPENRRGLCAPQRNRSRPPFSGFPPIAHFLGDPAHPPHSGLNFQAVAPVGEFLDHLIRER